LEKVDITVIRSSGGKMKTRKWDTARYLKTEEDVGNYLESVFEDGDPALIAHALGVVARAQGMARIAKKPASAGKVSTRLFLRREIRSFRQF
jgi:DNA-binding phage protein